MLYHKLVPTVNLATYFAVIEHTCLLPEQLAQQKCGLRNLAGRIRLTLSITRTGAQDLGQVHLAEVRDAEASASDAHCLKTGLRFWVISGLPEQYE